MKYCPLCRAEYREGFETCTTCSAHLVASQHTEKALANPPRLLWRGRNSNEFGVVTGALGDAQIPANAQEAIGGLLGSLTDRASTIHVLSTEFDRALQIAAEAVASHRGRPAQTQVCYNCATTCSAFLAACPNCKAQLIAAEPMTEKAAQRELNPPELRYCPLCGAEYVSEQEHCTICGVGLVGKELRGKPLNEKERKEPIDPVWRGGDPAAVSNVVAILRESGIPHHVQASNDHLVFELAMPRPKYIVRVFRSDAPRMRELLAGIQDCPFFGAEISSDFNETGETTTAAPRGHWNPAAATSEIWSGRDPALARLLEDCFFENRIPYQRHGTVPGTLRYFVLPSDERAAKEIVREVRDSTPPA